ncbi:MAG TPA: hypothetical protein VM370_12920 [Candidatus Thermoplasmatota archaeon]|nr:hypothetical protein [Candidatus Thermoplasmatota archaeon]
MRTLALLLPLALALSSAGCIANMADLKDKMGGSDEPVEPAAIVDPTPTGTPPVPTTPPAKPPVARVSVFGANGALVYKSSFTAEDPATIVFVEEKTKLSLIASDSEALEPGASVTGFAWSLDGKPLEAARQATTEIGGPGLYVVKLVVTDSNGKTDDHSVKIGVQPKPYDVVTELTTGPIAGAQGQGQGEDVAFDLALPTDKPTKATAMTILVSPDPTCDVTLEVIAPDGNSTGEIDDGGVSALDQAESASFTTAPAAGAWTIRVAPFACAAPNGIPITVTVTYLEVVAALSGSDGHGHQH